MKFLRLLAVAMPLCTLGLQAADQGISTPESLFPQLDAILKKAITQSPRMIARAVDEEIAEQDRIAARAALLPTLGGNYRLYDSADDRADINGGRVHVVKTYYDVTLTQPLFHWNDRRNTARIGQIRKEMAAGNYRAGYAELAREIRGQYLRLIVSKLQAKRAAFNGNFAAAQLKRAEDRLEKKVISDAQIFTVRMDAERSQINAERMQFEYEDAKRAFARLTGQPVLADDEIPDAIPAITSQDAAMQRMLAGFLAQKDMPSAAAVNMRKSLEIERLNLAITKTRLLPKFNAVAGLSQDEQSYTVNVADKYAVNSLFFGFSANWMLFDGFAASAAKRAGYARVQQLERDYNGLTEFLGQTAQSQARRASLTARTSAINDRYLVSSEGNLKSKQEEFSRGVISEEDITGAQMNLYESQVNAYLARMDYYTEVSDFLGTVVEDPILANIPKS